MMVSICCTTFNHVNYIASAIESFLAQEVEFSVEILIHDDASIDGTQSVLESYENRFSEKIKVIYQTENQYSKGLDPLVSVLFPMARGKYIAICDGDDYWTDPFKLKKQVEFLESNPDYVICGHDAYIFNETGVIRHSKLPEVHKQDASSLQLQKNRDILTLSACFRNVGVSVPEEYAYVLNGDTFLFSWLGTFGKYKYMGDIKPAAYRAHEGGVWSLLDTKKKRANSMLTYYWLAQYYKRVGSNDVAFYHLSQAVYVAVDELCALGFGKFVTLNYVLVKSLAQKSVPRAFGFLRMIRNRVVFRIPTITKHDY